MKSIHNTERMIQQMELLLINTLLHVQRHNYSSELLQEVPNIAPRHVKFAEDYIEAHYAEDIGIEHLLEVSDVSARALYSGFQKFRNTSPMKFLKATRLDKVHQALRHAGLDDCVTRIAIDHGFKQLGRFSSDYRQRFGESPSATLKFRR